MFFYVIYNKPSSPFKIKSPQTYSTISSSNEFARFASHSKAKLLFVLFFKVVKKGVMWIRRALDDHRRLATIYTNRKWGSTGEEGGDGVLLSLRHSEQPPECSTNPRMPCEGVRRMRGHFSYMYVEQFMCSYLLFYMIPWWAERNRGKRGREGVQFNRNQRRRSAVLDLSTGGGTASNQPNRLEGGKEGRGAEGWRKEVTLLISWFISLCDPFILLSSSSQVEVSVQQLWLVQVNWCLKALWGERWGRLVNLY